MAIKAKIQLDNSELKAGLKQAESQAKNTGRILGKNLGKDTGKGLDQLSKGADSAVRALDSVAGATGQASTGLSGLAGDIIDLVKNPIAMAIAAIGAVIAIGTKLWNMFTLSSEEAMQKTKAWSEALQKSIDDVDKQHQAVDKLVQSFIQLNNVLPKTGNGFATQLIILKNLENIYGELGVQVDEVKQKLTGVLDAMLQIESIKFRQKQQLYGQKLQAAETQAYLANAEFYQGNSMARNNNPLIRDFPAQDRVTPTPDGGVRVTETYSNYAQRMFQQNGSKFFLNLDKEIKNAEALLKGGAQMGVNTSENIAQLQNYLNVLYELKKARQEFENLEAYGDPNADASIQRTVDLMGQLARIEAQAAKRQQMADFDSATERYQDAVSAGDFQGQRRAKSDQTRAYHDVVVQAEEEATLAKQQYLEALQAAKNMQAKIDSGQLTQGEAFKAQQLALTNLKLASDALFQAENNYAQVQRNMHQLLRQEGELADQQRNFRVDRIKNLDREIQLLNLSIQGQDALIKRQQLLNDLQDKGYKMNDRYINEIMRKQMELSALKLRQQQQEEGHNLIAQSMRLMGQERQAMEYEAIRAAQQKKVGNLTQEEIARIKTLVGLKYKLSKMGGWNLQTTGTLTNELASRGGFNRSVHTDSRQDINTQIFNKTAGIYNTLQSIPQILRNIGVIQ